MAGFSAYRDPYDSVCNAAEQARGLEELILALMESPDPCDKALGVLYATVQRIADDLDGASSVMKVKKAS